MIEGMKKAGGTPRATAYCDMADCDRQEVVACAYHRSPRNNGQSFPDEKQVHAKLQGQGWALVKGKLHCPSCEAKRKVVPMKKPAPEMTKRERIQIVSMLSECYDLDAERYTSGDTDETVAEVLKVRPGFVAQVREEMFGPAGGNEDMAALEIAISNMLNEMQGIAGDCKNMIADAQTAMASNEKKLAEVKALKADLEKIKKAVGPRVMRRA